MKNRKLWVSILAGILAVIMILSLLTALIPRTNAASSAEIAAQIRELKNQKAEYDARIKELQGQISENKGEMKQIVAQKDIIDQQIFLMHEQVRNINDQITAYGQMIADKQAELDDAQAHLNKLNADNKERIRAMEEGGTLSYWSVLFKANSFSDLLDRINMIEEIAAADQRRLEEMSRAAKTVASAKESLETEMTALEETKKALKETQAELEVKRAEAESLLMALIAKGEEYEALLEEEDEKTNQLLNEIAQKETEKNEAQQREYLAWLATQGGSAGESKEVDGIIWLTPVSYNRFSSPWGMRIHPIYGDLRFHNGVDLGAAMGAPIIASRSGVVTVASYDSGSGYYVSLNHMDGFTTKYLHMTHYIVSPGQYVAAGEVIGYVGSTGASTGPHLHFSVFYNGVSVNPANYIKIK